MNLHYILSNLPKTNNVQQHKRVLLLLLTKSLPRMKKDIFGSVNVYVFSVLLCTYCTIMAPHCKCSYDCVGKLKLFMKCYHLTTNKMDHNAALYYFSSQTWSLYIPFKFSFNKNCCFSFILKTFLSRAESQRQNIKRNKKYQQQLPWSLLFHANQTDFLWIQTLIKIDVFSDLSN